MPARSQTGFEPLGMSMRHRSSILPSSGFYNMPYKDKNKQLEYQKLWAASRRREWLGRNGPCKKCGSDQDLEVDHIDPKTKINHKVWTWKESKRNLELAKCQVLCWECHKDKTINEQKTNKHGLRMYEKWNCRCSICKKSKSIKNAKRIRKPVKHNK